MVCNKGVKVAVNRVGDGRLYQEYTPTQSEAEIAIGVRQVYLKTHRGEYFYVTVELQRHFDFKTFPVVEIACSIGERQAFGYVQAEDVKRDETVPGRARPKHCQATTRRFMEGRWTEPGEDVATILAVKDKHSNGTLRRGIDTTGCLCVRVTRGYTEGSDSRQADVNLNPSQASTPSVELSGRYRAPRLARYLPLQDRNFPTHDTCFRAAIEDVSESIVVVFEYRSQIILKQLGITPKHLKPWTSNRATATSGKSPLKLTMKVPHTSRRSSVNRESGFKITLKDPRTNKPPSVGDEDMPLRGLKRAAAAAHHDEVPRSGFKLKLKRSKCAVTSTSAAAPANGNDATQEVENGAAPAVSVEDDELEIIEVRPAPVVQTAASSDATGAATQGMTAQERQRKKTLLKMRLAEMELKREIFELGD